MQHDSQPIWCFTDDDRDRLQPLLDMLVRRANYAVIRVCELAGTVEMRLEILQGVCEHLAESLREQILQQVDRGEWAARGILCRDDVSITVQVDAEAVYRDPTANLVRLTVLPVERLS